MEKDVSTILFDLGGVILNLDYNLTIEAFNKIGKESFKNLYSQASQDDTFDLFETGQISKEEFRNYIRNVLGTHLTDEMIDSAWNAMLLDLPEERVELLLQLKERYRICLFSNTNAIHLRKFQEIIRDAYGNSNLLEELFHKTYYSHLIGERKPNQSAFEYILKDQSLRPEEVLFIDDSIQHIKGAESLGMATHHLIDSDVLTLIKRFV